MKKFVITALLFLVATLGFAQDGRTKVNYYNRTSQTLQMLIDGNPACSFDVMPGGTCTDSVNPGSYIIGATNGKQTTRRAISLEEGQTFDYTLTEEDSVNTLPNQSRANFVTVADPYTPILYTYTDLGFSIGSPIVLTRDAGENTTTHTGSPYVITYIHGTFANDDYLAIFVGVYNMQTTHDDLARIAKGFAEGAKGTIESQYTRYTSSGQEALCSVINLPADEDGRVVSFAHMAIVKGNRSYQVVFGTYTDTKSDMDAVAAFFKSFSIL
jgi:hypothetical protein